MPSISAPILTSSFATSWTSGSQAAHSMTVVPGASTAAIMTFSVPVTVDPMGPPRYMVLPARRRAVAMT